MRKFISCLVLLCLVVLSSSTYAQTYKNVSEWLKALKSTDSVLRLNAAHGLESIKDPATGIPLLLKELSAPKDYFVLTCVMKAVGAFKIQPSQTIPVLIGYLRKKETEFLWPTITFSLSKFGDIAIPYLKKLYNAQFSPYNNESTCYFGYSIPSSHAVIALAMIGEPVLQSLENDSGWNKGRMLEYLYDKLEENIPDEELADHYHVLKEFTILENLLNGDTTKISFAARDSCLRKILRYPLLSKRLFRLMDHLADAPGVSGLAARILMLSPSIFREDIFSSTSKPWLVSDSVLQMLGMKPIETASQVLNDLSISISNGFHHNYPVSLDALNNLAPLLLNRSNDDRIKILTLMGSLKAKEEEMADFQTPIVQALVQLSKRDDNIGISSRFHLWKFSYIPEVWQLFVSNFANGDIRWGEELNYATSYTAVRDSLFVKQVISLLDKAASNAKGNDYPGNEMHIALYAAAVIDSTYAPMLVPPLLSILEDTAIRLRDFEVGAVVKALLSKGSIGRSGLKHYALSSPKENLYLYAVVKAIKEAKAQDSFPEWLYFIRTILQRPHFYSAGIWELYGVVLGKEGFMLLDPLLKVLNDKMYRSKEETETIGDAIASIGDTIIPVLVSKLDSSTQQKILLKIIYARKCAHPALLEKTLEGHLRTGGPEQRKQALQHLSNCPVHFKQFSSELDSTLDDQSAPVVSAALTTLQKSGREGLPFLGHLYRILRNRSNMSKKRLEALFAIVNIGIGDTSARIFANKTKSSWSDEYEYGEAKLVLVGQYIPKISIAGDSLIPCLLSLTRDPDLIVCQYSYILLGLADSLTQSIKNALVNALYNSRPNSITILSSQSLLNLKMPDDRYANILSLIEANAFMDRFTTEELSHIESLHSKHCAEAGPPELGKLTDLNWPPPPASTRDVIPAVLFTGQKTLGDVYNHLTNCLRRAKYEEYRVFDVSEGFALLTRLERISDEGAPAPRERWTRQKIVPVNITEYLRSLFLGTPGKFRVILFVVTPLANFKDNGTPMLTPENSDAMFRSGDVILPPLKSAQSFTGKFVHVLIYQFYKKNGGTANILHNEGVIPTMTQLTATQIIKYLTK